MLNYEPTLPLHPPPPTTHYLAVSSSSSSSTNTVIVRHYRHRHHHGVGCCLVPPAATPTSSPLSSTADATPPTTASPPPRLVLRPPLRSPPPPSLSLSRPLRPLDRPWRRASCVMDWHAASMPSLPVRRGKCRSRMRSPRRDTGPLRQCRRHSPAASGKPSFSRAAAASQATATAARRRCWSSLATRCRNDDAVTTTPDRHGHLRRPLAFGLLEGVV
jgi:hypothetical protein